MKLDLAVLSMTFVVLSNALIRHKKITSGKEEQQGIGGSSSFPYKSGKMEVEPKAGDEQKVAEATVVDPIKSQIERILLDSFAIQSIKIGDQLGIYVAMYEAQLVSEDGRLGLEDICELAKTDPRLTQEWLKLQERIGFVSQAASEDGPRFQLSLNAAKYLLPPSYSSVSMAGAIRLATCMMDLSSVIEAFETGEQTLFKPDEMPDVKLVENLGDSKSVENRIRFARESFCTKFFRDRFVDQILLRLKDGPELLRMLEQGEIDVAESFCGATSGTLTITMAARFRNTRFIGFETQHVSLTRARDLAHAADTKNARFYDVKERSVGFGPPSSSTKKGRKVKAGFGLVLTFMSLSMIDPEAQQALFKEVRQALDPSGYWIIMDLDAQQDDLAYALCSGMSLMHFIPSMKAPHLCSLFTANRCQELCAEHGFSVMEELPTVADEMLVRINTFALKI